MKVNIGVSTKILFSLFASLNLLMIRELNLLVFVFTILLALSLWMSSPSDLRFVYRFLRGFAYIFIFTFIAHFYFQQSGLEGAFFYTLRITGLLVINSIIALSIDTDDLINTLIGHLSRLKSNNLTQKTILIFRLTTNFVPLLKDEAQRVYMAQKCRGVDFTGGNIIAKANNYLSLFIPILVSCIKKADDISLAMKARRFNGCQVATNLADNNHRGK